MPSRAGALLTLSAAVVLLAAGCDARRPAPVDLSRDLSVETRLGTAGVVPDPGWTELRLRVANSGPTVGGEIEVCGYGIDPDVPESRAPLTYRLPVEIPAGGAPRELVVPVRVDGWRQAEVSFRSGGRRVIFPPLSIPLPPPGEFRILFVTEDPAPIPALAEPLRRTLQEVSTRDSVNGELAWKTAANWIDAARAPGTEEGYAPFHVVVLFEVRPDAWQEAALAALAAWVHAGGTLVVAPSQTWGSSLPASWTELFGIASLDAGGEVTPAGDARRRAGDVAYEVSRGLGAVTCFRRPVHAAGGGLPDGDAAAPIHAVLSGACARAFSFAGSAEAALDLMENDIATALPIMAGLRIPSEGWVLLGLLGYWLLGIELPRRVFRRAYRAEWAFAVTFVAAIAAVAAICLLGVLTAIDGAKSVEVSIARLAPGGGPSQVTTILGLVAPGFATADLRPMAGDPGAIGSGARRTRRYRAAPARASVFDYRSADVSTTAASKGVVELAAGGSQRLVPVTLYPNSLSAFRVDYELETGGVLRLTPAGEDGLPPGVFASGADPLTLMVVSQDGMTPSREIAPGDRVAIEDVVSQTPIWRDLPRFPGLMQAATGQLQADAGGFRQSWVDPAVLRRLRDPRARAPLWTSGQEADGKPRLAAGWHPLVPYFLVASVPAPISPPLPGFPERSGLTYFVLELPAPDW